MAVAFAPPDPLLHPDSYVQWARRILQGLGYDGQPNAVASIVCWMVGENPATPTGAANNPMNSTKPMNGSKDYNSIGVQEYKSKEDGLAATVATLKENQQGYAEIRGALQANRDYVQTCAIIDRSDWRGSNNHTPYYQIRAQGVKASGGLSGAIYHGYEIRHIKSPGKSAWRSLPLVGDDIANAQAAVKDTYGAVTSGFGAVSDFLGVITDPHTWFRIAQVLMGAIFIFIGAMLLFRGSSAGKAITSSLPGKAAGGASAGASSVSRGTAKELTPKAVTA